MSTFPGDIEAITLCGSGIAEVESHDSENTVTGESAKDKQECQTLVDGGRSRKSPTTEWEDQLEREGEA